MKDTKNSAKTPTAQKRRQTADAAVRRQLSPRWWVVLGILILAGLVQQVLILTEGWHSNPLTTNPILDAETYWNWAGEVAGGRLLRTTPFMSSPLYPYVLGVVRALGGGLLTVYVLQAALHLLTLGLLTYVAARRFEPAVGLLTGALYVLLTEPAFYTGRVLNCSLQILLIVVLWWQLSAAQRRPSLGAWAIVGVLTGLNCLANPPMLLAIPLLALWSWWQRGFKARGLAEAAVLVGCAAAAVTPATWHNYLVCGELIPVSAQAGVTFAQGNAPGATGTYTKIEGVSGSRQMQNLDARRFYREATGQPASWNETSRFFFRKGLAYWRENPAIAVKLFQLKLYWFVTGHVFGDIYLPVFEVQEGLARFLRVAPLSLAWLTAPALLGLLTLLRSSLRRYWPEFVLIIVPLLVVALFWYSPRYRFPATPVLVAVAAWAFHQMLRWRTDTGGALLTGAALFVGLGLWWSNRSGFDTVERFSGYCYGSVGVAHMRAGNNDAAIRYFETSLEYNPDNEIVRANLGLLRGEQGDRQASIEFLQRAVQESPDSFVAHDRLARALVEAGRLDEALERFRAAVRLSPDNADIRANFGNALWHGGRYDEAAEQYRAALGVRPAFAEAHVSLGRLLERTGDADGALHHLSQAVRFAPKQSEPYKLMARIYLDRGNVRDAIATLRRARELKPEDHRLKRELAWVLATSPGLTDSERSEAIRLARAANEASVGASPTALDTLAAALAASGEFEEAIRTVRRAIELSEQSGNQSQAHTYRERLELYEAGRSYVEEIR